MQGKNSKPSGGVTGYKSGAPGRAARARRRRAPDGPDKRIAAGPTRPMRAEHDNSPLRTLEPVSPPKPEAGVKARPGAAVAEIVAALDRGANRQQ